MNPYLNDHGGQEFLTQFFLKQSCEQKKLPLIPIFKHVGHCKEPASLGQSLPMHFFFVGGSSAIVSVGGSAAMVFVEASSAMTSGLGWLRRWNGGVVSESRSCEGDDAWSKRRMGRGTLRDRKSVV